MDDIIIKPATLTTGKASLKTIVANDNASLDAFLKWASSIVKDKQDKHVMDHFRAVSGIDGKPEGDDAGRYTKLTSAVALVKHFGTVTAVKQARKNAGLTGSSNPSYLQTKLITNGGGSSEPKARDWDKWAKSVTKDLNKREINKAIKALQALV
jgi:hypothetical protein